jgi:hypothetical protein
MPDTLTIVFDTLRTMNGGDGGRALRAGDRTHVAAAKPTLTPHLTLFSDASGKQCR